MKIDFVQYGDKAHMSAEGSASELAAFIKAAGMTPKHIRLRAASGVYTPLALHVPPGSPPPPPCGE